jgi:hypothetical protein
MPSWLDTIEVECERELTLARVFMVKMLHFYILKVTINGLGIKGDKHIMRIFYQITSSTCTLSIWCRFKLNGANGASGTHRGRLTPMGPLAFQLSHNPCEASQINSPPLDQLVFSLNDEGCEHKDWWGHMHVRSTDIKRRNNSTYPLRSTLVSPHRRGGP